MYKVDGNEPEYIEKITISSCNLQVILKADNLLQTPWYFFIEYFRLSETTMCPESILTHSTYSILKIQMWCRLCNVTAAYS